MNARTALQPNRQGIRGKFDIRHVTLIACLICGEMELFLNDSISVFSIKKILENWKAKFSTFDVAQEYG